MPSNFNASFVDAIKKFLDSRIFEILHTCMPGKITKYNSKTRKATVLPLINKQYDDGSIIEYKPITSVPVMFYGAGNSGIRLPEREVKNQECLLFFSEHPLEYWLKKGGKVDSGSKRRFDLTDAIAIVGLNPFTKEKEDSGGDDLEIYYVDSVIRIKQNGDIEMGINTFKKLVTESIKDIFNNHVHNFIGDMGAQLSTSPPASMTATLFPPPGTGGLITLFGLQIADSDLTSVVKVE
ncbi:MAG: hypothetical protein A2V66_15705 [Ignavibacteria bacterium RBG_13_36_8]|nr:MAG: hypothetical protein A2V66_15705 [Ignavibacteria bacterium RBG_13_36_8]